MYDYDTYLLRCADEYLKECEPKKDGDGDVVNCPECDNKECEYYNEYHEEYRDEYHDEYYEEPDYSWLGEMDEALLWGI